MANVPFVRERILGRRWQRRRRRRRRRRSRVLSSRVLFVSLVSCRVYPDHASRIWEAVLKEECSAGTNLRWNLFASYIRNVRRHNWRTDDLLYRSTETQSTAARSESYEKTWFGFLISRLSRIDAILECSFIALWRHRHIDAANRVQTSASAFLPQREPTARWYLVNGRARRCN